MNEQDKNKDKSLNNSELKQVTGGEPWGLDPDRTWKGPQEPEWRGDPVEPYTLPNMEGPSYRHEN